jgi:prepilin-type processing-associated H-X9-DG protein
MLLPALRSARESANRTKCAAQLRQVGVAFEMYANANSGWLPAWSSGWKTWPPGLPDDTPGPAWTIELIPYIGNPDSPVYNCPSFPERTRNYFIEAVWSYVNGHNAMKMSDISMSSQFVLSGDITQTLAYPYPYGKYATSDADLSDEYGPLLMFPDQGGFLMHRGGDNVLFADSHVETFAAFDSVRITFHPTKACSWEQVSQGGPD